MKKDKYLIKNYFRISEITNCKNRHIDISGSDLIEN